MIYTAVFGTIALLGIADLYRVPRRQKILFFVVVSVLLVLLSALRWQVGPDWENYYFFFQHPDYSALYGHFEPGYRYLSIWIDELTGNYTVLLFIMALFFVLVERAIVEWTDLFFLALLGVFSSLYPSFLGGRQALATALTIYSLRFVAQRRLIPFLLCVFGGALFHYAAFFFLPVYWIGGREWKSRTLVVILGLSFLFGLFLVARVLILASSVSHLPIYVYANTGGVDKALNYGLRNALLVGQKLFLFLLFIIYRKPLRRRILNFDMHLAVASYGYAIFFFFFQGARTLAGRGAIFFQFSEVVLTVGLVELADNRVTRLLLYFLAVIFFLARAYFVIYTPGYFLPYHLVG